MHRNVISSLQQVIGLLMTDRKIDELLGAGMPPEDWIEPTPLPEEQEQPKASVPPEEDSNLKESNEIDISESVPVSKT